MGTLCHIVGACAEIEANIIGTGREVYIAAQRGICLRQILDNAFESAVINDHATALQRGEGLHIAVVDRIVIDKGKLVVVGGAGHQRITPLGQITLNQSI